MEERLANLISDSILPRLIPDIALLPWRRTQVLAVQVYPSPGRPHYLKRADLDGGVYVRVGSTNRHATDQIVIARAGKADPGGTTGHRHGTGNRSQ